VNDVPGFDIDEENAKEIVEYLQRSAELLNESVAYADSHCSEEAVLPFKRHIAEILADLGWIVLEQGFYKKYPNLRPTEIGAAASKE
jgi:hypothetical protein